MAEITLTKLHLKVATCTTFIDQWSALLALTPFTTELTVIKKILETFSFDYLLLKALSLSKNMVEGAGFEPAKAVPSDLQSDPFGHSGTPPRLMVPALATY